MSKKVNVTITIPDEEVRRVVRSAFGGGVKYWCESFEQVDKIPVDPEWDITDYLLAGGTLKLTILSDDRSGTRKVTLDQDKLYNGIVKFALSRGGVDIEDNVWGTRLLENFDERVADMIFQLALFGRIEFA